MAAGDIYTIVFDDANFNDVNDVVIQYTNLINEYYNSWPNYSPDEKEFYLELIGDMRFVVEELTKFIYLYKLKTQENPEGFLAYTVKEGDTIPGLANRFFDNDTERWLDIFEDNQLEDIKINPGDELKIRLEI